MQREAGAKPGEREMSHPRKARFWTLAHGSPVKLTLRPGQKLTFGYADRTDEGWTTYGETVTHAGDVVLCDRYDYGVDCDGRSSQESLSSCPLPELMAGNADFDTAIVWPAWRRESASQRDHTAEAAGY